MSALDRVREEIGPFTAWVAGNPLKYTVATFVLGAIAGRLLGLIF